MNKKVILEASENYNPKYDSAIEKLVNDNCILICIVGKDCETWEQVFDEIAVGDATNPKLITTTSHKDEGVNDVIDFAKDWDAGNQNQAILLLRTDGENNFIESDLKA